MSMQACIHAAFNALVAAPSISVRPSVPILYFGDVEAYRASEVRIITVALNPSDAEFPTHSPWQRFPSCATLNPKLPPTPASLRAYEHALNRYFDVAPYWGWFGQVDPILTGFEAGYRVGAKNRALHTDLMTPVATDPTWTGLRTVAPTAQSALAGLGVPLWHELVQELKPHIALISVANQYMKNIMFPVIVRNNAVHVTIQPKGKYVFEHQVVEVLPSHHMDVIFGRAGRTPFQLITHAAKRQLGPALRGRLTHWQ